MKYPKLVKRVAAFGANARPDTTAVIEEIVNGVEHTINDTGTSARKKSFSSYYTTIRTSPIKNYKKYRHRYF
jgi:hypothetical protein